MFMGNEKVATSTVINSLAMTEYLDPFINDGDKEPFIDGTVYVYSNKNKSKDDSMGSINVQVKSESVNKIFKDKISYSIGVTDLRHYLRIGGVVYFVVYLEDDGKTQIYYRSLLPYNLLQILEEVKDKKSKSIKLKKFPEKKEDKVDIFFNLMNDKERQGSTISMDKVYTMADLEKDGEVHELSFGYSTIQDKYNKNPFQFVLENEFFVYKDLPYGGKMPVGEMQLESATLHIPQAISAGGTQFYESYGVENTKEGSFIKIGKSIRLKLELDKNRVDITINNNGTLSEQIRSEQLIVNIFETGSLEIGDSSLPFKLEDTKVIDKPFDVEAVKNNLEYLLDVQKALQNVGVNSDLNLDNLTDVEWDNLRTLVEAFVYQKNVNITNYERGNPFGKMVVGNIYINLVVSGEEVGTFKLNNFFGSDINITAQTEDNEEYQVTQYVMLTQEDFENSSNIDYKIIYDDILSKPITSVHLENLNIMVLRMLNAYDKTKGVNTELLDSSIKICELMTSNAESNDKTIYLLNLYQCLKRKYGLDDSHKKELEKLTNDKSLSDELMMGVDILLENFEGAEKNFTKMSAKKQEEYLTYPIMKLWAK